MPLALPFLLTKIEGRGFPTSINASNGNLRSINDKVSNYKLIPCWTLKGQSLFWSSSANSQRGYPLRTQPQTEKVVSRYGKKNQQVVMKSLWAETY